MLGGAAERHASVHRRRRADAPAGRRARDGLGRAPGRSRSGPAATRTTRSWPRRSRSGRCRCSARCCRATSRSSTRSTAASSTTCGARFPGDDAAASGGCRSSTRRASEYVRMAHLACVGSHAINGVAALHTELLKQTVLSDFHRVAPEKFLNVTNGVTPRRWMALSNPRLSALITRHIGDRWIADLEDELPRLEPLADDAGFQRGVAGGQGRQQARAGRRRSGSAPASRSIPQSLFDIQVKRLHEYKRQHLNVLHLITLYNRLRRGARRRGDAAHGDLRRQGGARLPHGQADHQADQRRRATSSTTTRSVSALPEGRVPAGLQRQEQPAHLSGRRPVGADLHGRQGGVGHRQHEVRHERRADHRHARRRQRRDPRRGRAARTSSCSG